MNVMKNACVLVATVIWICFFFTRNCIEIEMVCCNRKQQRTMASCVSNSTGRNTFSLYVLICVHGMNEIIWNDLKWAIGQCLSNKLEYTWMKFGLISFCYFFANCDHMRLFKLQHFFRFLLLFFVSHHYIIINWDIIESLVIS